MHINSPGQIKAKINSISHPFLLMSFLSKFELLFLKVQTFELRKVVRFQMDQTTVIKMIIL